jgi:hypothetical protein
MDLITGEKIQFLCDHFIGNETDFKFNPNVLHYYRNKCLYINKINNSIDNKYKVFCYTHILYDTDLLISKLTFLLNPFILIFHNSDYNFEFEHLILFKKLTKLKYIYTQNMKIAHDKVFPLPIGIANSQWNHGNLDIFNKIINSVVIKSKNIYFNFTISTNKKKRSDCFLKIKNKNITWIEHKNISNYLIDLKKHKYCICPEGNGIDTHRLWECLYLDVIPICLKNNLTIYYSKIFPIILLNDWNDLITDNINNTNNMKKINKNFLQMEHINLMQSK